MPHVLSKFPSLQSIKTPEKNGSRNHPEVSQFYGKILTINERNNYEEITETIMKKLQTN